MNNLSNTELSNIKWYAGEAMCHSDPNYQQEFYNLVYPGNVLSLVTELQQLREDNKTLEETVEELKNICAESYQVVGYLAYRSGVFDELRVIKALDNLSSQEMLHKDILPFSLDEDIMVNFEQHKLRELVDLVWNTATESTEVPSTKWADELITKVFGVYKNDN
ncbi:TPA: hypothetical protein MCM29_005193 [Klebsiella pneumoniae]|nr:hypothetical protein [Klebsiella pneumoniae]